MAIKPHTARKNTNKFIIKEAPCNTYLTKLCQFLTANNKSSDAFEVWSNFTADFNSRPKEFLKIDQYLTTL